MSCFNFSRLSLLSLLFSNLLYASSYESFQLGDFSIGGAVRLNYIQDSSKDQRENVTRASSQGVFDLDTARINIDYAHEGLLGKFEYRWYPGFLATQNGTNYSFIHTLWLGYQVDQNIQLQVGINRVPFGPTAYGVSQSWFFDQHYYVGLADDMDLGVKISARLHEGLRYDLAYYPQSEPEGRGAGAEATRYAYDVVNEFQEKNQIVARMIYSKGIADTQHDFGVSFLYSTLEAQRQGVDDGSRYALSAHMINMIYGFRLATQITRYEMAVDVNKDSRDDALVTMGGFNYAEGVASKAWLPSVSLSYTYNTPNIEWLDSFTPYIEYSNIIKDEQSFNDSYMCMFGSAFARGNWYIYADLALANGNYFVGPYTSSDGGTNNFGANSGEELEHRLNINFGYYF